jgi:hypothetical protein
MTEIDRALVRKNIALMQSAEEGGMRRLAHFESVGGRALYREKGKVYPAYMANFIHDVRTGRIVLFTNKPIEDVRTALGAGDFGESISG